MKDVRMPSVIAFFAYWVVGIPICYYLSFLLEMGVTGIWVGFIIGLTLAAICIMMRFFNLQKKLTFVT
jgi:MATE family multidrug resistance protein